MSNSEGHIYCKKCGRLLQDPLSKRRGYGPICWKKMNQKQEPEKSTNSRPGTNKAQNEELNPYSRGMQAITAERHRQLSEEGFSPVHDDGWIYHELFFAGSCYYMYVTADQDVGNPPDQWPWELSWWKPTNSATRNLEKAGALFSAEIERLQRMYSSDEDEMPISEKTRSWSLEQARYFRHKVAVKLGKLLLKDRQHV